MMHLHGLWIALAAVVGLSLAGHGGSDGAQAPVREDSRAEPGGSEAVAWGPSYGGVRIGLKVQKVPGVEDLFTFVTLAENCTNHSMRIAFGDYGTGPQHPVYPVIVDGAEVGCIIPHHAYGMSDPHNPQGEFPMKLPAGEIVVLYTTTFVPPLGSGTHRVYARVPQAIYSCRKAEDPEWRKWVVEQTRATIGSPMGSTLVSLTITGK